MPTKKNNKFLTWKRFGETWYRTQVVAAKTKSLFPLAYRVLTQYTVLVHLIYLLNINLRFRCSGKCSFTYGVRGCTCKMTSFLDSTHVNLPNNITDITVIDCDRYNLLVFNVQPRNSFAK